MSSGVRRMRFWARIVDAHGSPETMCRDFCAAFGELAPAGMVVEPPGALAEGSVLGFGPGTMRLHCDEVTPRRVTLAAEEAQPRAGLLRFFFDAQRSGMVFEAEILGAPAAHDSLVAAPADGTPSVWHDLARRVVDLSGGSTDGVHEAKDELDEDELQELVAELETTARRRRRTRAG